MPRLVSHLTGDSFVVVVVVVASEVTFIFFIIMFINILKINKCTYLNALSYSDNDDINDKIKIIMAPTYYGSLVFRTLL